MHKNKIKKEIFHCRNENNPPCPDRTYNTMGFRGKEIENEKSENVFRIIAVGSSTTLGGKGSDSRDGETWPAYLEQILNNNNFINEIIKSGL